jgi:two-component system sensor histidine kinase DctS
MDLGEAAQRAIALLARDLRRLQLQVDWAIAPGLPKVDADPVLIEQVILNLVRNACDEMAGVPAAQRRLRVGVSRAGSSARPGASDAEGFLRLDVDDGGPGLRGRSVEQLVTPFYSTKPEGMGMGLAICRSIIEAHHGAFDATDGTSGGARFSFTLPVAGAWPSSELQQEAAEPAAHAEDLP